MSEKLPKILKELRMLISPGNSERAIRFLVLINILFLFCRFQFSIPILAEIYLSLVLMITAGVAVLPKLRFLRAKQTYAMIGFLLMGALWVPFARNNHWAFRTVQDLFQTFLGFVFPIIAFLRNGAGMRILIYSFLFILFYLGVFSILNKGFGPGGFLGDENDLCAVLVALLAYPLFLIPVLRAPKERLFLFAATTVGLAGIVITNSRGGFLGLLALLGYFFFKSYSKILTLMLALLLAVTAVAVVPDRYWNEMASIRQIHQGTARQRLEIWDVALRVWLYPPHFIAGTGMRNVQHWLRDFEPEENYLPTRKSIAGRSVHSTYLQLTADLGLIGLFLYLVFIGTSYLGNARSMAEIRELATALAPLQEQNLDSSTTGALRALHFELRLLSAFLLSTNGAWFAHLVAITFIDTLYYPTVWVLGGISLAMQYYSTRLRQIGTAIKTEELPETISSSDN